MKILLVTATAPEIKPLLDYYAFKEKSIMPQLLHTRLSKSLSMDLLITGPGLHHTAFHSGRHLANHAYDLAINAGICGSFKKKFPIGSVVTVGSETIADFGAENKNQFIPASKIKLYHPQEIIAVSDTIENTFAYNQIFTHLPIARSITVNTVHGNAESIQKVKKRLHPDIESMEGFAFFYACKFSQIPFLEIRSVSNMVEIRNTANWKTDVAIQNLNTELINGFKQIQ